MPKDESEAGEKLPELFDIHVMFFADTSSEAVAALQRAFSLERSVAEKLIADVPVMVKRAASPEVADSLLDVLNNLGAQVVLLPSTQMPSVVPDDAAGNLLSGGGQIWGGLELNAPIQSESSTRLPTAQVVSLGRKDPEPEPLPEPKPAPRIATPVPVRPAPIPRLETPIPAPVAVAAQPDEAVDEPDRFALDPTAAPLELQHLEPTPRVYPGQLRQRSSMGRAAPDSGSTEAQEFDLELELDPIAEPPAAGRASGARESDVDLGLGSVPPLPSASAARPAAPRAPPARQATPPSPPTRVAKPTPPPAVRAQPSGALASETAGQSAVLPDLQLALPSSGDTFWSAKRKPAGKGRESDDAAAARAAAAKHGPSRSQPPRSSIPAEAPRSRTFALSALVGGVLLFALSAYFDQSIFSGSANPLWVVVQGLGFLGVGTGCARIRR